MTTVTAPSTPAAAAPASNGVHFAVRDGRRMDAWMLGPPGQRRLQFALHVDPTMGVASTPVSYGWVPLRRILNDEELAEHGYSLKLGPNGNTDCHHKQRITIPKHIVDRLAEWAQTAALGRKEGR